MMQRIATLPKKVIRPEVARLLNRTGHLNPTGNRWVSIAVKAEPEKKPQKDDRPFIKLDVPELRPVYLDAQATNPMDPRVLDAMLPFLTQQYGNPHSRNHYYGWESEKAVEKAREQVANLIGADPKEIIFTSGATESNNIALKGVARFYGEKKNHIVTTQTEHKCVLDSCRALEGEGFKVTYLPVQTNGLLDLKELEKAITPETALVSVMTVHNEIGVRQPIPDISAICKAKKVLFHTDAAQAVGKVPIDVHKQGINLMSISGHKIYGPKGIGALYVGRKPRVRLVPIQSGGGQERGLRSGTVPAPLAVGMGAACEIAQREMAYDKKWIDYLSKRLHDKIMASLTHVIRNGDPKETYPGCLNLSFAYVEGESLMMALKDVALSSGSACTSASLEPSYVLRAIGTDDDLAHSSIRIRFASKSKGDDCEKDSKEKGFKKEEKPGDKNVLGLPPGRRALYIDAQATSIVDPRVLDAMLPYFLSKFGNASSTHFYGAESKKAVEKARQQIATLIGAKPNEIVFTSGATESNNMAIKGCMWANRGKKDHLITVQTEHKCILESARSVESEGCKVTLLPVKKDGLICLKELESAITPNTALVSVMAVNNEIGVIQPLKEIAEICDKNKVVFHTDAAQATGKIPLNVRDQKIRLMSMSGHKIYGPKGIGALFVCNEPPVKLHPHTHGGGQEFGFRSGTHATPMIVAFGAACEVAKYEMARDHKWISFLSKRFQDKIHKGLTHVIKNADTPSTYPGCFNLSFSCVEGEAIMMGLKDIAVSSGSACSAASMKISYVLKALGMSQQQANGSIRFGIGRFSTVEEIDYTAERCIEKVSKLREMSPLWEMVQEGIDLKTIIWSQH